MDERVDRHRVRDTARRLADTADDVARTLDDVADAREQLAGTRGCEDADAKRQDAQRVRDFADEERAESRRLSEKWDLAPRGEDQR